MQSDYQRAVTSINLGTPLIKSDSRSKLAKEIRQIAQKLLPEPSAAEESKPKRAWAWTSFLTRRPA
jgi:MinD-like ATPase involved in chromosome partitioning or flagellar assembly